MRRLLWALPLVLLAGALQQTTLRHKLRTSSPDDDSLQVIGGAEFGSGAYHILPSGRSNVLTHTVLSGEFDLARLTAHTVTLSEDVTNFRWVHLIAGEDDINGLGLGVISVPLAVIPVATPTIQAILYGVDASAGDENLYQINRTSGAATLVGSTGVGVSQGHFNLAEVNASLFGVAYAPVNAANLFTIDRQTGAAMLVGATEGGTSSAFIGFAGMDGSLYLSVADSSSNSDLYAVNPITGAAMPVRNNYVNVSITSLAGLNGVLYGTNDTNLYSGIQPGGTVSPPLPMGQRMIGLAGLQGALYGVRSNVTPSELYIIDEDTGVATLRGEAGGSIVIVGLAGLDIGVSPAVRLHIVPNVRVDMWRPTGTTDELGFYSEAATTILQVVGVP